MMTEILFTIYFIILILTVVFLGVNFIKIRYKFYVHPKIVVFIFPFLVNFILAQTVFYSITPLLSTLLPCLLMYWLGNKLENVRIIGLTGGIATGKSTLVKLIKSNLKLSIIDCDQISRQLSKKDRPGYRFILSMLGERSEQFLHPLTREIEREKFSNYIFQNPQMRRKLTKGMGKFIMFEIFKTIFANIVNKKYLMLIDAPILYETKVLEYICYPVVVVGCPENIQLERLQKRNEYSEKEAEDRVRSQMPLQEKKKRCQVYINNVKTEDELLYSFLNQVTKYVDKDKATSLRD